MMDDNAGKYCFINGVLKSADSIPPYDTESGMAAYEVIRVIGGKPLFLEDHLRRMDNTLSAVGNLKNRDSDAESGSSKSNEVINKNSSDNGSDNSSDNSSIVKNTGRDEIKASIRELAGLHSTSDFNVKLVRFPSDFSLLYIKKSRYPSADEYAAGVCVRTALIERSDPNAKIERADYKAKVAGAFHDHPEAFEILLADLDGHVTEGSKSNLFVVKNGRMITAPGECILKGITRQYILEACARLGIPADEKLIDLNELYAAEGVFISGTSIKVLPVSHVDGVFYDSPKNSCITAVGAEFDRIIKEYLAAG